MQVRLLCNNSVFSTAQISLLLPQQSTDTLNISVFALHFCFFVIIVQFVLTVAELFMLVIIMIWVILTCYPNTAEVYLFVFIYLLYIICLLNKNILLIFSDYQ